MWRKRSWLWVHRPLLRLLELKLRCEKGRLGGHGIGVYARSILRFEKDVEYPA